MKRIFIIIVVLLSIFFKTTYAQNRLQLADTIKDETGMLRYFKLSDKESAKGIADAESILRSVFKPDNGISFTLVKTKTRGNNRKSFLYQQNYLGIPVYDGYYYLHFTNNVFTEGNGEYAEIKKIYNTINLNKPEAIKMAMNYISTDKSMLPSSTEGEVILWRQNRNEDYRYVYKVEIIYPDAQRSRECMVDAATGEVIIAVPVVCYTNVACTGTTVYSGSRNFTGDSFSGGVRLRETRNGVSIKTMNNQNNVNINAIDFVNTTTSWTSAGINEGALDLHFATEKFLDYFRTVFSRNSIDDNGHSITCYTNRREWTTPPASQPMDNAFFDPNDITFSFGQGNIAFNSVTSLDVVTHELGHGVAFYEVGFNNTGEASSLNEGFSDIWGATIENWSAISGKETWTIGEEIMANGFSCLRSLRSPTTEGFLGGFITEGHYPDTRLGPNWDNANADPHVNATVLGHWYYLLSQGGNGTNGIGNAFNVTGIGINDASQIAYFTELALTPSADFISVRAASIAYTSQNFGAYSCEVKAVTDAWYAVGVGNPYQSYIVDAFEYGPDCNTIKVITPVPSTSILTWTTTQGMLINGNPSPQTITGNSATITSVNGNYANITVSKDGCISGTTDFCPCVSWPGNPQITWIWSSPAPGEPLEAYVSPAHPTADRYIWMVDGVVIQDGPETELQAYDYPCTWEKDLEVIAVDGCGATAPVSGGPYSPLCGNYLSARNVIVYPNPASSQLTVRLKEPESVKFQRKSVQRSKGLSQILSITMYDNAGQERKIVRFTKGSRQVGFPVEDLSPGVYYIKVSDDLRTETVSVVISR